MTQSYGDLLVCLSILLHLVTDVFGHGRLSEPPSRSSAFRYGFSTPYNYEDLQLNCGGFWNQWGRNQGLCGVCGDPYQGPRENEAGGKYATGTIVRHYKEGQQIIVKVEITAQHGGWSEFRLCPNNNVNKTVTQQCLDQHLLATPHGKTRFAHTASPQIITAPLVLPQGVTCTQCVLQWKWNAGTNNNCNYLTRENCCVGCGPQEQRYNCADVSIEVDPKN